MFLEEKARGVGVTNFSMLVWTVHCTYPVFTKLELVANFSLGYVFFFYYQLTVVKTRHFQTEF